MKKLLTPLPASLPGRTLFLSLRISAKTHRITLENFQLFTDGAPSLAKPEN